MKRFERKSLERMTVKGHFVFASKRHAVEKLDYDKLSKRKLKETRVARRLGKLIANEFPDVDAVATVADGANGLAGKVSRNVSKRLERRVEGWQTRKTDDGFELQPSNIFAGDKNWVIVDDIFTRGTNTMKVASTLHRWGGRILGVCTYVNRSSSGLRHIPYPQDQRIPCAEGFPRLGDDVTTIPVVSHIQYPMEDYTPEACPQAPSCPEEKSVIQAT